jgi:hypothetical protein
MKKVTVLFALLIASLVSAETKFIPLLDADLRLGYSNVSGRSGGLSGTAWAFFMPAFKFSDNDYLIPVYNLSYTENEKVVTEDTFFGRRINNLLSAAYKHKFDKTIDAKISIDGRYNFNMETRDETLGKGLYDLWDIGFSASGNYNLRFIDDKPLPLSLGFKYYRRTYPNYTSLASTSTGTVTVTIDKEKTPKNFDAYNINAGWKNTFGQIYAEISYNMLLKSYIDAYGRTTNGEISDTKRYDPSHYLDISLSSPVLASVTGALDINYTLYGSNCSIFDNDNLIYTPEYYAFTSISARPSLVFNIGELTLIPYYQFLTRTYKERLARLAIGTYTADKESDTEHTLGINSKYPLAKSLNGVLGISYFSTTSNMKYEQFVMYTYNIFSVSAGLSYSY